MHTGRKEGIAWQVCMCRVNRRISGAKRGDSVASVLNVVCFVAGQKVFIISFKRNTSL